MRKRNLLLVSSVLGLTACAGGGGTSGSYTPSGDYYTITFDFADSSSRPYKKEVAKGSALDSAPNPARTGYDFSGWYTLSEGGESVNFPYTPTQDITLYAHWSAAEFDVTFDLNYEGAPESTVVSIAYGESVSAPETKPEREHFVFRYWTLDAAGEQRAEFPYLIKKDTTFYASWRDEDIRTYTVTVHYGDYDGAPEDKVFELEEGQSITLADLPNPTRTGYDFKGWALSDGGAAITLPFAPTSDADLYALWEVKSYKLEFYYNYVDSPKSVYYSTTYVGGADFNAPETDPTREGYSFAGWYTANKGGNKVTFPTTAYRNLKYYAHWESLPLTTNTFHAEYCAVDPNFNYPGYSGAAKGDQCIVPSSQPGVLVDNYPTNSSRSAGKGFAVSYQYTNSAVIRFEIDAAEDITGAELSINWSTEFDAFDDGTPIVFTPSSSDPSKEAVYEITVNGKAVNYEPTQLVCDHSPGAFAAHGPFTKTVLGTVNLKKGTNIIELSPNNSVVVGAITAIGPVVDYIEFDYSGSDKLSWKPVYDNLDGK
ncbi:MAG: InlB B-repeat-containing protein [Bacilli bacterium]|nr:InlB B-repeat-containing protein [Bacilli bacterium]